MSRTDYVLLSIAVLCLGTVGVVFLPVTHYGGAIGIVGVVVGVLLQRWVGRVGRISGDAKVENSVAVASNGHMTERVSLPIDHEVVRTASDITFWIEIDLFNERDAPTGLRELAVVFRGKNNTAHKCPVFKHVVSYSAEDDRRPHERVSVVNLPSGAWVHLELMTGVDLTGADAETQQLRAKIEQCTWMEFCGRFPSGKLYREPVRFPESFGA